MLLKMKQIIAILLCMVIAGGFFTACNPDSKETTTGATLSKEWNTFVENKSEEKGYNILTLDELRDIVETAIGDQLRQKFGDKYTWDSDYSSLTDPQKWAVEKEAALRGYNITVTNDGIILDGEKTPGTFPDKTNVKAAVEKVAGERLKKDYSKDMDGDGTVEEYEWDEDFSKLTDDEKKAIEKEIKDNGFDVAKGNGNSGKSNTDTIKEIGNNAKTPLSDTAANSYVNQLFGVELRKKYGDKYFFLGDYKQLTAEQKKALEKALKALGYDVTVDDKGIHYNGEIDKIVDPEPISKKTLKGLTSVYTRTLGGESSDAYRAVCATKDGGYAALALTSSSKDGFEGLRKQGWTSSMNVVVKYDAEGNLKWKQAIGGDMGTDLTAMAELSDGSFIAVGSTYLSKRIGDLTLSGNVDALMAKFSSSGELVWLKVLKGSKGSYFSGIASAPDGGFVTSIKTEASDMDYEGLPEYGIKTCLYKFDKDGNTEWKYALTGNKHGLFQDIDISKDGDIFAVCHAMSWKYDFALIFKGNPLGNSFVIKLNKNGQQLWLKTIYGNGKKIATSVTATGDGGCVVGGAYNEPNVNDSTFASIQNKGEMDMFMIRYASNGDKNWIKTLGGTKTEGIDSVAAVEGGFVAVGASMSADFDFSKRGNYGDNDMILWAVDEKGSTIDYSLIGGSSSDSLFSICKSNDGKSIVAVGQFSSGDKDFASASPKPKSSSDFNAFLCKYDLKY